MAEYIEKETAIAIIIGEPPDAHYPHWYADKIKAIPAANAVPVVHGRWVHNDEYVLWAEKYVCSVCNCNAPSDGDYRHNLTDYCPNCGAKMDLE